LSSEEASMTVNDGLPPDESAAYDAGHADVEPPLPAGPDDAGRRTEPPTDLLPLPTVNPPAVDPPTQGLPLDPPPAGVPAPAESTTDGSVAGDLFDAPADR
jgi:hypothetical protein